VCGCFERKHFITLCLQRQNFPSEGFWAEVLSVNVLHGWVLLCCPTMVVLETATTTSAVGFVDPLDSYSNRSCMKLLPKRFINVHQWLGPICAKQLKETLVSYVNPCYKRRPRFSRLLTNGRVRVDNFHVICFQNLVLDPSSNVLYGTSYCSWRIVAVISHCVRPLLSFWSAVLLYLPVL
jgi:hypothetical protein